MIPVHHAHHAALPHVPGWPLLSSRTRFAECTLLAAGAGFSMVLDDPMRVATAIATILGAIGLGMGAGHGAYRREKFKADKEYNEANEKLLTGQLAKAIAELNESNARTKELAAEHESMRSRLESIEAERDRIAANLCEFAVKVLQEKGFIAEQAEQIERAAHDAQADSPVNAAPGGALSSQ